MKKPSSKLVTSLACAFALALSHQASATVYFNNISSFGGGDFNAFSVSGSTITYNGANAGPANGLFDSGFGNLSASISNTTNGVYYFGATFLGDGTAATGIGFAYPNWGNTPTFGLVGNNHNLGDLYDGAYVAGTPVTMIGRLTVNGATSQGTIDVWLNPVLSSAPVGGEWRTTTFDITQDITMAYINGNMGGIASASNIIISDSWTDIENTFSAIPEPTTVASLMGLVALGAAFIARRRRRVAA